MQPLDAWPGFCGLSPWMSMPVLAPKRLRYINHERMVVEETSDGLSVALASAMGRPVTTPLQLERGAKPGGHIPPAMAPLEQALPPTYFSPSPPEAFFLDRATIPAPTLC